MTKALAVSDIRDKIKTPLIKFHQTCWRVALVQQILGNVLEPKRSSEERVNMRKIWVIALAIGILAACSAPEPAEVEPTVIGGVDAEPHEFPFMVGSQSDLGRGIALCGGSILSENWVITAGHCVGDTQGMTIIAGDHSKSRREESEQRIEVEEIIISESYLTDGIQGYDAALLRLSEPLELNDKVQPVPYASSLPEDGSTLTAIGWGSLNLDTGASPDVLQKVDLTLDMASGCRGQSNRFMYSRKLYKRRRSWRQRRPYY